MRYSFLRNALWTNVNVIIVRRDWFFGRLLAFCKVAICFITFVTWDVTENAESFSFSLCVCVALRRWKRKQWGGRRWKIVSIESMNEMEYVFYGKINDIGHRYTDTHNTNSVHFLFLPFIQARTDSNNTNEADYGVWHTQRILLLTWETRVNGPAIRNKSKKRRNVERKQGNDNATIK